MLSFYEKASQFLYKENHVILTNSEYYYSNLFFRKIPGFYKEIQKAINAGKLWESEVAELPFNLSFGLSQQDVNRKVGRKPAYNYQKIKSYKISLYKLKVGESEFVFQMQFFGDKLFFVCMHSGIYLKDMSLRHEIIQNLYETYLNVLQRKDDEFPIIRDGNGNFVLVNDDVNFGVCYLDGAFLTEKFDVLERAVMLTLATQ